MICVVHKKKCRADYFLREYRLLVAGVENVFLFFLLINYIFCFMFDCPGSLLLHTGFLYCGKQGLLFVAV